MKKHGLKLIKMSRKELTQNYFCFYFTIIFQKKHLDSNLQNIFISRDTLYLCNNIRHRYTNKNLNYAQNILHCHICQFMIKLQLN